LTLIGAVAGDGIAIAIFLDRTNQKIVRLRQGETHAGWELSSVLRREVTRKKATGRLSASGRSCVFPALPAGSNRPQAAPTHPMPLHTPLDAKHGGSDGL
jgi:general secretion pathway protein N